MKSHGLEVILTHEHTDFDALASLLAASLLFRNALPILPARLNRNVADFVALYRNQFPFLTAKELPRRPITRLIYVDTRTANLPRRVRDDAEVLIIDHHVEQDDAQTDEIARSEAGARKVQLWHEPLGANTTMLVEELREQRRDLSSVQATLLALGIHEDTGSLTYAATTVRDAQALAWLMGEEQGVNLAELQQFLRHPLNPAQHNLLQTLIDDSEFVTVSGHTVLIAVAEAPDSTTELSTLAHRLRDVYEADAIFLVVQLEDVVQVVARSLSDEIDVGAVTSVLGGGGHPRAAAAAIRESSLMAVRERILELLAAHSRPNVTVRQIMTSGRPQMLAPDLPVAGAAELMRRYGHEGFPVVELQPDGNERLLGVLTRRETDRALNHGLDSQPVRRFMQTGPGGQPVTIQPGDSVAALRKTMIESGWGQIPVVDQQQHIIGIVTRTDLIKLWDDTTPPHSQAAEIDRRLHTSLAPAQVALLRLIGEEAEQLTFSVYVVGGFVRDLLLNGRSATLQSLDMDIVIEGDAIRFAQQLQAEYGGRIVTHKRFGTAKWILDDPQQPVLVDRLWSVEGQAGAPALPEHLDFVTARTEFYTEPSVLPTVELSNIKLDLHRRDFTINTLAFSLNPDRWGELLDFYGGYQDLEQGVVRVLHSLSFVDDPTRILRAVRYEQRFDFTIDPRTLELIHEALEMLDRVTPARIRHELERILQEPEPERALQRLAELDVLARLNPALVVDEWLIRQFARLRTALGEPNPEPNLTREPQDRLYWGLLTLRLSPVVHHALTARLGLRRETQQLMAGLAQLTQNAPFLADPQLRPSQAVALIEPVNEAALALYLLTDVDDQVAARLHQVRSTWQQVRPMLTGVDLQRMGLPPGPLYSHILRAIRNARLDGEISTHAEEIALAKAIAQQEGDGG